MKKEGEEKLYNLRAEQKQALAKMQDQQASTLHSTAVWTVAPMIIHVKRVTMHSYPG